MESHMQLHRHSNLKPAQASPSKQDNTASSHSSNSSVSESSALRSTPSASGPDGKQSSVSSLEVSGIPSNSSSSDGTSNSESSSSDSEDEVSSEEDDDIVTIGGPRKPVINSSDLSEAKDLRSRLAAFLPQMQRANAALGDNARNIEDVEDGEPHIEMDLGLGVLEEEDGASGADSGSSDGHDSRTSLATPISGEKAEMSGHIMDDLQGRSQVDKDVTLIKEVG